MLVSSSSKAIARSRVSTVLSRTPIPPKYVCPTCRRYATAPVSTASPLLLKLRNDLKVAMRAKDTNRLNVVRSLLAEITNSEKTSNPIQTDMQLLSLLRKRAASAQEAIASFKAAGRKDMVQNEQAQSAVLGEYADSVETMGESDIKNAVTQAVEEIKAAAEKYNMGDVLKKLLGPGGSLESKPVERSEVARIVKQTLGK